MPQMVKPNAAVERQPIFRKSRREIFLADTGFSLCSVVTVFGRYNRNRSLKMYGLHYIYERAVQFIRFKCDQKPPNDPGFSRRRVDETHRFVGVTLPNRRAPAVGLQPGVRHRPTAPPCATGQLANNPTGSAQARPMTAHRADDRLRVQPPNVMNHLPRRRPPPLLTRIATTKRCWYHAAEPLIAATVHSASRLGARRQVSASRPNGPGFSRRRVARPVALSA